MERPSGVVLLLLLSLLVMSGALGCRSAPAQEICTIAQTQVIRIPVSTLHDENEMKAASAEPASLLISAGATDEPPEGPDGFDVLDDGVLLISDPLRGQVSAFDPTGKFLAAWKIGFPADSITATEKGVVLVRDASTGNIHAFDRDGRAMSGSEYSPPERMQAQVSRGQNAGTVRSSGENGARLEIRLAKPGVTLLSIEGLARDAKGDTYVALETTVNAAESEEVNVSKFVRRYSPDNKLLGEITNLPLDYYVAPVDELRVHNGIVYQLQTTGTEVRVNKWDTNPLCSHAAR
jgi:hypothetical protein